MNVHHLELFYYVARHGGIMPAVRKIPYGIQQPAVSAQVAQLEEDLGVTLFHRRPFALTLEGEMLFQFIEPFFGQLDKIADELRGDGNQHLRIGASPIVLRDYLPQILKSVRKKIPELRVSLREGYPSDLEQMLEREEIDMAVSLIEGKAPAGIKSQKLLELPLVLLVEAASGITSAGQLWRQDKINERLVCLPAAETISKNFQSGLAKAGVEWFPSIETSSLELIETYVENGLGVGVSLAVPGKALSSKVRALPLPGFAPVVVGALWRRKMTPLLQALLEEMKVHARRLESDRK